MKRLIALLTGLAALVACNSETTPAVARLSGTYDMVLVGNLVFVTSADRNELRVLDLAATPRDFVRAPNPIEPLSIPVIERAVGLVKDLNYDKDGAEISCPEPTNGKAPPCYVYAYSAAAPSISIVGTEVLKELLRLPTADKKPVSAVSAVGPGGDHPDKSVLYYATSSGTASTIYKVQLSAPDELEKATVDMMAMPVAEKVKELANESVSALLALPKTADFPQEQLVVATRSLAGRAGRTLVLPGETPLAFPYPVRLLATHPYAEKRERTDEGTEVVVGRLPARTRIFGVLDEEACGSTRACRGILATDVNTGAISKDFTGQPMLTILPARGLLLSLSLAAGKFVLVPNADLNTTGFSLLGMGAASDGKVFFFDAWSLRVIDADPSTAAVRSVVVQSSDGTVQSAADGVGLNAASVSAGEGIAQDENVAVTFQGIIPGLSATPTSDAGGQRFSLPDPSLAVRVKVGDIIVLTAPDLSCSAAELTVSRAPTTADPTFDTATPIPAVCAGRTAYALHAAGTDPFTVVGEASGYLGRTGWDRSFDVKGTPYTRGDPYDPTETLLHFTMGPPDPKFLRGWRYVLTVTRSYDPLFFAVDAGTFTGFYLPTSVVQLPSEATVLVSYPSANGIIEFTPVLFGANQLNSRNLKVYQ